MNKQENVYVRIYIFNEVNIAFFFSFHVGDVLETVTSPSIGRWPSTLTIRGLPEKQSFLSRRTFLMSSNNEICVEKHIVERATQLRRSQLTF